MQVAGYVVTSFFMAVNGKRFQGENFGTHQRQVFQSAFFPGFPQGNLAKIPVTVGVAAHPGPGAVQIVVDQEHLLPVRTDHPGGSGQVGNRIVPGIQVLLAGQQG